MHPRQAAESGSPVANHKRTRMHRPTLAGDKAHEEMRGACFDYLALGGIYSSGPVSLLSGLNPRPSVLVMHFFMVRAAPPSPLSPAQQSLLFSVCCLAPVCMTCVGMLAGTCALVCGPSFPPPSHAPPCNSTAPSWQRVGGARGAGIGAQVVAGGVGDGASGVGVVGGVGVTVAVGAGAVDAVGVGDGTVRTMIMIKATSPA